MAKEVGGSEIRKWGFDFEGREVAASEEAPQVVGPLVFRGLREIVTELGESTLAEFEFEKTREAFGCPTALRGKLAAVAPGTALTIHYLGKGVTKSGGRELHLFRVFELEAGERPAWMRNH